ncbi:MAG: YchJ family metal-binding protein [Gammaproteobacteria bacterium]|nr:YchJ family metal-binding protein [Gammaproteobacteria bacterium]MDH5802854.1 YchJ family metal-binding protein [Gammaproteobacteria bacterium]
MQTDTLCPCGSESSYTDCCGPYLDGSKTAPTAESLMRSRYVAYSRNDADYLLKTWHHSTRPEQDPTDSNVQWIGLQILRTEAGGTQDDRGLVEFRARCRINGQAGGLDEASEFIKEEGQWFYVDGSTIQPIRNQEKQGRNDPCACGSGKKYKKCCGQ